MYLVTSTCSPAAPYHGAGERGKEAQSFAVRNPSPVLQAKKTVTCTASLPIHIPQNPFASACWDKGREEDQLSSKHLRAHVGAAQPLAGSWLPSTAMQAASHRAGWRAAAFLGCASPGAAEPLVITR